MDDAEVEKYRLLRHAVPERVNTEVDKIRRLLPEFHKPACDFECAPAASARWICRYHDDIKLAGLRGFVFGHILQGRLHVNLLARDAAELCRCEQLMESWRAPAHREGALLAAENGIGKIKAPLVTRYLSAERRRQIRRVLAALAPQDLLHGQRLFI
jgi:FAD/FMN-containing dehydrogenase